MDSCSGDSDLATQFAAAEVRPIDVAGFGDDAALDGRRRHGERLQDGLLLGLFLGLGRGLALPERKAVTVVFRDVGVRLASDELPGRRRRRRRRRGLRAPDLLLGLGRELVEREHDLEVV